MAGYEASVQHFVYETLVAISPPFLSLAPPSLPPSSLPPPSLFPSLPPSLPPPTSCPPICLQGLLTLTNGTTIEGLFGGNWHRRIDISRGVLEDGERCEESIDAAVAVMAELQ